MNREILFRGKRLDNGEWVTGHLITDDRDGKEFIVSSIGYHWEEDNGSTNRCMECFGFEVDPKTVGQYTGLKDKNGVKIFEGDVVQRRAPIYKFGKKAPIGDYLARGKVVWDESSFTEVGYYAVSAYDHLGNTTKIILFSGTNGWYVIGNIYDNPDLPGVRDDGTT